MPKYKERKEVQAYIQTVAQECRVEGGQHAPDHVFEALLARWFDICGVTRSVSERGDVVIELASDQEPFRFFEEDGLFVGYPGELAIDKWVRICIIARSGPALKDPENRNLSEGIVKWELLVEMIRRKDAKLVVKSDITMIKLRASLIEQFQGAMAK